MKISYLKKFLSILLVFFFFNFFQFGNSKRCISSSLPVSCFQTEQNWNAPDSLQKDGERIIHNVYRVPLGEKNGNKIWIVDGLVIRREIFCEFLYGGNDERYIFVPMNEIWIDHAITAEEYKYTVAHELHERDLMARYGMSYADAHDSSLALELQMRIADQKLAEEHEQHLRNVSPTDCDGVKQISELADSMTLHGIYRQFLGKRVGVDVWVVDGSAVRRKIFPDFGLSGNGLAYHFIPGNEIWIDGQISCEETEFSIASELRERELLEQGWKYDDAYSEALKVVSAMRKKSQQSARKHFPLIIPEKLVRDIGTGKEKN